MLTNSEVSGEPQWFGEFAIDDSSYKPQLLTGDPVSYPVLANDESRCCDASVAYSTGSLDRMMGPYFTGTQHETLPQVYYMPVGI